MGRHALQGTAMSWSLLLPVAVAVALGVLAANAIGFATGAIFLKHAAAYPIPVSVVAPDAAATSADARDGAASKTVPSIAPLPVLQPVRLPGPTSARRDGESRACINGSIALRVVNGWQQEVLDDVPARCLAGSP